MRHYPSTQPFYSLKRYPSSLTDHRPQHAALSSIKKRSRPAKSLTNRRCAHAPAPPQKTLDSALRITENETQYQSVAHQDWRGQEGGRACLRIDRFKVTQSGQIEKEKAEREKA